MNVLPIIVRELRAESRHRSNYLLRLFGASLATLLLAVFLWNSAGHQSGAYAFGILNFAIFCSIWIVVPIISADCLSREKREGTLGLLFLTPLKPIEIILGKGTIHAIRSLTLLIAVIPILTVPFILGGITQSDVLWNLLMNLSALALSLAAGLLASSFCQQWTRSLILALIFATVLAAAFLKIVAVTLFSGFANQLGLGETLQLLLHVSYNTSLVRSFMPAQNQMLSLSSSLLAVSILICLFALLIAAARLKNSWQHKSPSPFQLSIQKTFCTPRFWVGFLRRQNQKRLSRNPIGWLQQYTWSSRLVKWGWCGIVIVIVSLLLTFDLELVQTACKWLNTALLVSVAFSAVGSFQREKQNGALELLLVTPLQEKQIIFGRLRGIWSQFLPAFLILLLSVRATSGIGYGRYYDDEFSFVNAVLGFIIVPVVGLYLALRMNNFLTAWLVTCGLTLFLPWFLPLLCEWMIWWSGLHSAADDLFSIVSQFSKITLLFLGVFSDLRLFSGLRDRAFILSH